MRLFFLRIITHVDNRFIEVSEFQSSVLRQHCKLSAKKCFRFLRLRALCHFRFPSSSICFFSLSANSHCTNSTNRLLWKINTLSLCEYFQWISSACSTNNFRLSMYNRPKIVQIIIFFYVLGGFVLLRCFMVLFSQWVISFRTNPRKHAELKICWNLIVFCAQNYVFWVTPSSGCLSPYVALRN